MRKLALLLLSFSLGLSVFSQKDSIQVFNLESFFQTVREEHPIARQAIIRDELGKAQILEARGGFDPKVESDISQKYFKGQEYYDYAQGKLKVPTWFGIELEGGYERNEGVYLNPESNVPSAGLWFAGVSVPIGQGLFIDQRRASLRQAQAMLNQNQAERDIIFNDLLLEAGQAYWYWFNSYYQLSINREALDLANQRYTAVKSSVRLGDKPAIDTLEAGIQVQNRILNLQQAELEFKNAVAHLSTFLWSKGFIPLELAPNTVPEPFNPEDVAKRNEIIALQIDSSLNAHPEIRSTLSKQEQLGIEKRWVREQLKPELNLKYKPITEAVTDNPFAEYSVNNYTWGLQFEFPIFLRKERAKLRQINLKLENTNLSLETKRNVLNFKAIKAKNEFETTQSQIILYGKTVEDYKALLAGERRLFNGGESSLFMINSRELGFIKAELKMVELVTKNRLAILKINHALGQLR